MAITTSKVLVTDLASAVDRVPEKFVRPISDRPTPSEADNSGDSIPLIDLRELHGPRRADVVLQLAHACRSYGFFQIKNHGVPETTVSNMLTVAREFFRQPESERLRHYTADTTKTTRLSTSFNVNSEKVSNWRDFLRLHCHPLEEFRHEWPSSPPSFRDTVAEYSTAVRKLVLDLLEAISESLGLSSDGVEKKLGRHGQHMAINYYPPCPQPELTFGLPGHTDPNLITVLLQDDVSGLQVFRNGKWVSVHPVPNTFIVNIGDQMQVISNDEYKSVLHRAVVNSEKERVSIPTFYCPSPDAVVGPADELITDLSPSVYRSFSYSEYYDRFWNRGLAKVTCLDLFRASSH